MRPSIVRTSSLPVVVAIKSEGRRWLSATAGRSNQASATAVDPKTSTADWRSDSSLGSKEAWEASIFNSLTLRVGHSSLLLTPSGSRFARLSGWHHELWAALGLGVHGVGARLEPRLGNLIVASILSRMLVLLVCDFGTSPSDSRAVPGPCQPSTGVGLPRGCCLRARKYVPLI